MSKETFFNILGAIWFWSLVVFLYWLLFGGGELNSPSLGIHFILWMGQ